MSAYHCPCCGGFHEERFDVINPDRLQADRDRLLEALKELSEVTLEAMAASMTNEDWGPMPQRLQVASNQARAAIAAAEKNQLLLVNYQVKRADKPKGKI